eukprot:5542888-Pyramimonas_sp.AAC.1
MGGVLLSTIHDTGTILYEKYDLSLLESRSVALKRVRERSRTLVPYCFGSYCCGLFSRGTQKSQGILTAAVLSGGEAVGAYVQ